MVLYLFLISAVFSFNSLAIDVNQTNNERGTLIVKFLGLKSSEGNIKVALANSKSNYSDHNNPYIGITAEIKNNISIAVIENIPFGEYAVKAFHDEDANDKLNTNFLGIPMEDYGFSNNARGTFGPPSWEDAKFQFAKDTLKVEIIIR
ncbi:MAG TPA: DUF2141 domain-containing protein [Ignavibacteriaceae bacterium]|nr:DUF2141 domain-containing protein [Ignavibacteriaceae bacterium]